MTALALNTPVIATNEGAFPKYIEHNTTSMLMPVNDPTKLTEAICSALNGTFYLTMGKNIRVRNETESWSSNKTSLQNAYFS
jgi:glycosyltransferase involved in cell wall biosynthesis